MKILLTGSNGQLGRALAIEFAKRNFEVLAADRKELDISDSFAVENFVNEMKPDAIINAAAFTAVDAAENERELALAANANGPANLAAAGKKFEARLIHFSTDYVFDGENPNGYRENDTPNPINFYGASKLAGEHAIQQTLKNFAIIRTSWLFGDGPNFVRTMLRLADEREEISIVGDQFGSPTFAADLATKTVEILESDACGIFHRTNDGVTNWADFAAEIFQLAGKKTRIKKITTAEYPTPAARPRHSVLLSTKLPPLHDWQSALAEYLQ